MTCLLASILEVFNLIYDSIYKHSILADSGEGLSCCKRTNNGEYAKHSACKPILIPSNDPFYMRFNNTCLNFVRQAAAPSQSCTLGSLRSAFL